MATCFLFIHHLTENGCLSLSLDQQGHIIAPLIERSFAEIKSLQKNCQTILVLSTQFFSLHRITLPWLAEKKARAALPFALEDKLAQNVNSLHFAFDSNYYQDGQYLIIVGDKTYLSDLIKTLDEHEIDFNAMTLDWFALDKYEVAILDSYLLINDDEFQGALGPDLANLYLQQLTTTGPKHTIYVFSESNEALRLAVDKTRVTANQGNAYAWIAQRLQTKKTINLCQGELAHGGTKNATKRWTQAAVLMTLIWILTTISSNAIQLYYLNKDITTVDTQIATIYRQFFPQAKQIISPKFRITQLLKANQNTTDISFWTLLNTLAKAFNTSTMSFAQIRFQNQMLLVTLTTKTFEELENLQTHLQKENIKVRQTQASTESGKVVGTLELSL